MATATDTDQPFRLSSLIGEAGVGSNGELLVNTLLHHYPPELRAATLKRENEKLLADIDYEDLKADAAKIAGRPVLDATIRGGERHSGDAVVTYAYEDERGDVIKGAFPYEDLGKSSSRGHVSQADALASSPAARDHESAQSKAREAAANAADSADVADLREQVETLSARLDDAGDPEPYAGYRDAKAKDIATTLADASRETADRVLEYERAHESRSTVIDAATKRIDALDAEDREAEKAAAARDAENEELRAQVAELQAKLAESDATAGGS